jgi:hypothetical protein
MIQSGRGREVKRKGRMSPAASVRGSPRSPSENLETVSPLVYGLPRLATKRRFPHGRYIDSLALLLLSYLLLTVNVWILLI